jgi:hypothetical protein
MYAEGDMAGWQELPVQTIGTISGAAIGGLQRAARIYKNAPSKELKIQLRKAREELRKNPHQDHYIRQVQDLKAQVRESRHAAVTWKNAGLVARDSAIGGTVGNLIGWGTKQVGKTQTLTDPLGFRLKDLQFIEQETAKYKYGKDIERLLDPATGLKVYEYNGAVFLQNYDYVGSGYRGVCHEVSDDLLAKLQAKFKDRYCFFKVAGNSPRFFNTPGSNHLFILGCTPANKQKVLDDIQKCAGKIPKDALLIDPSFNVVDGRTQRQGYLVNKVSDALHHLNSKCNTVYSGMVPYQSIPLGFRSELTGIPDTEDLLVYLSLKRNLQNELRVSLDWQPSNQNFLYNWDNWEKEVPADSLLARFMQKVKDDLANPNNHMADLDKAHPRLNMSKFDPTSGPFLIFNQGK